MRGKRIGFCLEEGRDLKKAILPFADMGKTDWLVKGGYLFFMMMVGS